MRRAVAGREWIAAGEAVALLGVSPATLRRWADAGQLAAFTTPGGHRRFERAAVLSLLPAMRRSRPAHGASASMVVPAGEEGVLRALRAYLGSPPAARADTLCQAQESATRYGAQTRAAGLSTAEIVRTFQRLRSRLLRELSTGPFAQGIDAPHAVDLLMTAIEQCDGLLEACVGAHEAART
jgi:excisionase family DNA binding protein